MHSSHGVRLGRRRILLPPSIAAGGPFGFTTTGGLGNNVTRLIQGAAVALFQNSGGLQYILMTANDANKTLLNMGLGANNASNQFTGFLQVQTSATGTVDITIDGACNPGAGIVQGNAIVWFF